MKVYKYFSLNEYTLESFVKNYLWFSKPRFFNDPFDCNLEVLNNYNTFVNEISILGADAKDIIINNTREFGICCFSQTDDNIHMWAHYADGHKGICIEYDATKFDDYFSHLLKAKCILRKIDYRDVLIDLDQLVELDDTLILRPLRQILENPKLLDLLFEKLLLQKKKALWENERELRLIIGGLARKNNQCSERDKGYAVDIQREMITSVIFGHYVDNASKALIKSIFKIDVNYKNAILNYKDWKLDIV